MTNSILNVGVIMFQSGNILDFLSDPTVLQYIIGGIIALVVIIICCSLHKKFTSD
ncbi:MAG: hypothetical protein ACFFAA_12485 [Promethearchaeota archaeon]